jgi:hypothetical protein
MMASGQQQGGGSDAERRNDKRDVCFHGEVRAGEPVDVRVLVS